MGDPAFSDPLTEEDQTLARALLSQRSPEEIATALVRFHRAQLPAPEEVFRADGERTDRTERRASSERGDRAKGRRDRDGTDRHGSVERPDASEGMLWFRMNVGRRNNADPRWLVPIICRIGHITKQEIGVIRIFDRETKFEIASSVAARFASAARRSEDKDIHIVPAPLASPPPKDKDRHRQTAPTRGPKKPPRSRAKRKRD